ncbi:MAG: DNA mismatch repair protein MutL [Acidiphilium sp. 37-64-53]|uniref:DNA mismatch repair endonuclease MutL n=1 Tax=Acidiphilium TaxID=522 RepID=UPI000BDBA0B6|nr:MULTISPECIES: DNA mismatch repair endonuclease MutL [Acidiphilium]OYW03095.1 MAG: DNA mismatch repair protein MutL [Acidiphilium sp. 37-64-53]OZB30808.1 MAG: DNA mismatch repair protein MutL [Acidiphilium sp. 34-64-41]HQT85165.1 DNA mismatch repair endonuclease MutL [Acidiphilium rubrum]
MPIRLLAPATINRIAAGEVIERPAAAVKELVENALDAGARRIAVRIDGGGIARIEVTDDGGGIPETELALAITRHATSKLTDEALVRIATLGFRGEALPSIGAAARLTLVSRPRGQDAAARIAVAGGAVSEITPVAAPFGTSAIVEDLFYATPARRKFLRSVASETSACADAVRHLALAAADVAFALSIDGTTSFDVPAQDRRARVAALYGRGDAEALVALEAVREDITISGFISPASVTRATARHQHMMVNARPVRDPLLRMALRVAYRDLIPAGRHPLAALWLEIPPEQLDVNVHPAKSELRFAAPDAVRSLLIGAVQRHLATPAGVAAAPALRLGGGGRASWSYPVPASAAARGFAEAETALAFDLPPSLRRPAPAAPIGAFPLGTPLAQLFDTYILSQIADGSLVLIDQHAAHERLTELRLRAERDAGGIASQGLLSPVPLDMADDDVARLMASAATLAQLGVMVEGFGAGAVLIRAIPAALGNADPRALVRDIADALADTGMAGPLEGRLDAMLIRIACHRSIRAGRRLAFEEMAALLRAMEATPLSQTCPHGRPTVLKLTRGDLERMFGRAG